MYYLSKKKLNINDSLSTDQPMKKMIFTMLSIVHLIVNGRILDTKNYILDILNDRLHINQPVTFIPIKSPNIYEIIINGKAYIVRLNEEYSLFTRTIECKLHTYAAEQGFGPQILFHDASKHIIIMEKLDYKELIPSDIENCLPKLVEALHKMHAAPIDGRPIHPFTNNILKRTLNLNKYYDTCGINTNAMYGRLLALEKLFDHDSQVMIHQDLHPFNIFFDGTNFTFIDFETPNLDTPFVDLAHVALFYCMNPKHEIEFLKLYFGRDVRVFDYIKLTAMKCFVCTKLVCWMIESLPHNCKNQQDTIDLVQLDYTPPLDIFFKNEPCMNNAQWRYKCAISAIKTFEILLDQIDALFLDHGNDKLNVESIDGKHSIIISNATGPLEKKSNQQTHCFYVHH